MSESRRSASTELDAAEMELDALRNVQQIVADGRAGILAASERQRAAAAVAVIDRVRWHLARVRAYCTLAAHDMRLTASELAPELGRAGMPPAPGAGTSARLVTPEQRAAERVGEAKPKVCPCSACRAKQAEYAVTDRAG